MCAGGGVLQATVTEALDQLTTLLNPQQVCEVGTANWTGTPLQGPNGLQWVGAAGVVQQGHSNKGFEICTAPTTSVHQETLLHMQDQGLMACSGFVQEELCHRAMVTKALDQFMALLKPHKPYPLRTVCCKWDPRSGFVKLQCGCAGGGVLQGYGDKGPGSAYGPAQPPTSPTH